MSENVTLSPRWAKALGALLEGMNVTQAAQAARVNPRTLYRWMETPVFRAQLREGETRTLDTVGVRLAGLAGRACDVLADILDSTGSAPGAGVRRLAACNVLELLSKWRELTDFEERLSRLEGFYEKR